MKEIERVEQRLLTADDVVGVLAAGWDIFELVAALAADCANQAADMYPAFTFARGSAIIGRNTIALAPSMPADRSASSEIPSLSASDVYEVADVMARLASDLSVRLREAAGLAADDGDRRACQNAARDADQINELLTRDR